MSRLRDYVTVAHKAVHLYRTFGSSPITGEMRPVRVVIATLGEYNIYLLLRCDAI
jgi:hypothetical protein